MADIAAGKYKGVAREAKVHPVRVLDKNREGTLADVIAGLNYISSRKILPAVAVLSLGAAFSRSVNKAVETLFHEGILVIASAGNEGKDACLKSPASSPFAITVGALDQTDQMLANSNNGSCVSMYAPGLDIETAGVRGDENGVYILFSGTSAAAPFVGGVVALLTQAFPSLTPKQLRDLLENRYTSNIKCNCVPNRIVFTNRL